MSSHPSAGGPDIEAWPNLNNYLAHASWCKSGETEVCTCGLREAKERGRLAYIAIRDLLKSKPASAVEGGGKGRECWVLYNGDRPSTAYEIRPEMPPELKYGWHWVRMVEAVDPRSPEIPDNCPGEGGLRDALDKCPLGMSADFRNGWVEAISYLRTMGSMDESSASAPLQRAGDLELVRRAHYLICFGILSESGGDPEAGLEWIKDAEKAHPDLIHPDHPEDHAFVLDAVESDMCGVCGWVGKPPEASEGQK